MDLKRGGFDVPFIQTSLRSAVIGWSKMVKADIKGETPINRPQHHNSRKRRFKKVNAKANWFRQAKTNKSDPWETDQRQVKPGNLRLEVKEDPNSRSELVLFHHTPQTVS